uniref:Uncharacterized protein n=1 Tax=Nothobranchius furzeri TaxID=105023 RepID=A0A1A8U7X9_NOTFU
MDSALKRLKAIQRRCSCIHGDASQCQRKILLLVVLNNQPGFHLQVFPQVCEQVLMRACKTEAVKLVLTTPHYHAFSRRCVGLRQGVHQEQRRHVPKTKLVV